MPPDTDPPSESPSTPALGLEARIQAVGESLLDTLDGVLAKIPAAEAGPQKLAGALGIDKVLASRLLKAMRAPDAMTAIHRIPGPDPLRRVLKAAQRVGVDAALVGAAGESVEAFEKLIRADIGDRSALGTILSAWVPEARSEFETRRKQSAYRAMSQIKAVGIKVFAETVILWPNPNGRTIDIIGVKVVHGLHRVRPGVPVLFTTRGVIDGSQTRVPTNLAGEPAGTVDGIVLPEFSTKPVPEFDVEVVKGTAHYLLRQDELGVQNAVDLVSCDMVRDATSRYKLPGGFRRTSFTSSIEIPSESAQFDLLIHEDLCPNMTPTLRVYDGLARGKTGGPTSFSDFNLLDLVENLESLGTGTRRFGSSKVPRYRDLLAHVLGEVGLDGDRLRGYRVSSEYPIYGSILTVIIELEDLPDDSPA